MLVLTTDTIEGKSIRKHFGIISGTAVYHE